LVYADIRGIGFFGMVGLPYRLENTMRSLPFALAGAACIVAAATAARAATPTACPESHAGLHLPTGFCATIFADDIGHARHLAVAPSGVVYVNTWSGRYYAGARPHAGGFLVALQDTTGAGKANVIERFGETAQMGGAGGTGIYVFKNGLYAEINDRIVRYELSADSIVPKGAPATVVSMLPLKGDHPMHPFLIDTDGSLYVDLGSATNACQPQNRKPGVRGAEPCVELETRGGTWRYDADKTGQVFSAAGRYATGIRNGEGFALDPRSHLLFVTQHGRDQLRSNWPALYKPDDEATLPSEELLNLKAGGDYGWPECYYDPFRGKLVLAPEYGGDGGNKLGVCPTKLAPVAVFPAHWAPDGMVFYDKDQFPERYRSGVFIAFHGSWNRAPYPQSGYNVVFQPLAGDHAAGRCEVFADGFAGMEKSPAKADHRPTGVAVGPDGSLYVSDDVHGRIYKIVYHGASGAAGDAGVTACPSATAPADQPGDSTAAGGASAPPEAGAPVTASLPVPQGATKDMVALGDRIYHGQVGGAACTGCHGAGGTGTPLGPDLTDASWLWSDGSVAGISKTITEGVAQPKQYRSPMPPMGGASLSQAQVSALAAYVWALGHH
jgi:glucose/arabinose dehydrogenase